MRIFVIGGAGYIGSHICKLLKEKGYDPIVYDNLSTGHFWAVQFGRFIQGDVEDEKILKAAIEETRPKAIIHLASLINVRDSIGNPGIFYENLNGALTLLKVMVQTKVQHLVFSSSAAIYGNPQYLPIDENHPKIPINAYGKMKWAIEGMLEDFARAHPIYFAALRYFNASGADPSCLIGEAHLPETHLIPLAIRAALGLQPFLEIYGNSYSTEDRTAVRDYVHVLDLADAHLKALTYLFENQRSCQVNLGTGIGYSVKQVVDRLKSFSKREIQTKIMPRFIQDSPTLIANGFLAKKIFGWEPKYSDLDTIIQTAYRWHQAFSSKPVLKLKELCKKTYLHKIN